MNTRNNSAGADVDESELAGLSQEERDALAVDPNEAENLDDATADLSAAAGHDDADGAAAADAQKAAAEKAATDKAAAEKAEAEAKADAENEEKAEAARVAKEAAEASAKAAADAQKAIDDAKAADAKTAAAADDDDEPFVATYNAPPVEDYDKKVGALDSRVKEATENFKAGDMTLEDYDAERAKVERERRDLDAAKLKADIASEQQVQTAEQRWTWEINRFYRRVAKEEGVNYTGSTLLLSALDTRVKELANMKENQDKDSTWFLDEAHRQVKAELGIGKKASEVGDDDTAKRAKADAEARKKLAEQAAARRPPRKDLPKDLGGLPAAGSDTGGGEDEFAQLDNLEGMELENALARMPKEKADRYLMGR